MATLLFDGVCNLCAFSVRFIMARDPNAHFRFASLQSPAGQALLRKHGIDDGLQSVVLIEDGQAFRQSDAALRVARRLAGPWSLLWPLRLIPRSIRDEVYAFIARHRYRWFGRRGACLLPTPDRRARLLENSARE